MQNKTITYLLIAIALGSAAFWVWSRQSALPNLEVNQQNNTPGVNNSNLPATTTTATGTQATATTQATKVTLGGYITVGKNVRSFNRCRTTTHYWVTGSSATIKLLEDTYKRASPNSANVPIYAVLTGYVKNSTVSGYTKSFEVTKILKVDAMGSCQ